MKYIDVIASYLKYIKQLSSTFFWLLWGGLIGYFMGNYFETRVPVEVNQQLLVDLLIFMTVFVFFGAAWSIFWKRLTNYYTSE
ncbi:MAG: hypothetical protein WBQ73_01200 [Candidatus Babeliales bacterium]